MRPLPDTRSRTHSGTSNNVNGVDSSPPSSSSGSHHHPTVNGLKGRSANGGGRKSKKEPIVVTRSKSSVKSLRSGRLSRGAKIGGNLSKNKTKSTTSSPSTSFSSSCSLDDATTPITNGGSGVVKNGSNTRTKRLKRRLSNKSASASGGKSGVSAGAYARHYKSYRRSTTNNKNSPKQQLRLPRRLSSSTKLAFRSRTRPVLDKTNNNLTLKKKERSSSARRQVNGECNGNKSDSSSGHSKKSDKDKHKDKGGKRRSALWVLNCEAEEFLFGETAADKHELELPPSSSSTQDSPPPKKKRRRWRETELSHLLETSPLLESKLRSCSSSSEDSSGGDGGDNTSTSSSPARKRRKQIPASTSNNIVSVGKIRKLGKKFNQSNSSNYYNHRLQCYSGNSMGILRIEDIPRIIGNLELLSPTSSIRSTYSYIGKDVHSDAKALLLKETVAAVSWTFSFERGPLEEPWYGTFSRADDAIMSYKSFLSPLLDPVVLPYEMDQPFRRSRKKLPKNARISPRCHASTLAILSLDIPGPSPLPSPTRTTRHSVNSESAAALALLSPQLPSHPPPAVVVAPDASLESVVSTSVASSSNSTTNHPSIMSPFTKFVSENSIRLRTRTPSTAAIAARSNSTSGGGRKQIGTLSAQQYLWDSIQFLSDPYVVSILAGDEPEDFLQLSPMSPTTANSASTSTKTTRSSNYQQQKNQNQTSGGGGEGSNGPVKKLVQKCEASERKASLRSCDGGGGATTKNKSSKLSHSSKAGRNHHSHGTKRVNGTIHNSTSSRLHALNGMSKKVTMVMENRSPQQQKSLNNNISKKSLHHNPQNGKTTQFQRSRSPCTRSNGARSPDLGGGGGKSSSTNCIMTPNCKSPVVMVSDIFKNSPPAPTATTSNKRKVLEEDFLFLVSERLPPLPSWPVTQ